MRRYCRSLLYVVVFALGASAMLPAIAQENAAARFVTTTLTIRGAY
jgi:hypothetical protein